MNLKAEIAKLREQLKPAPKLEVKIVYSLNEITDINAAIWVVFKI